MMMVCAASVSIVPFPGVTAGRCPEDGHFTEGDWMRLSESRLGRLWLSQFAPADRPYATLLLDCLSTANQGTVFPEVTALAERMVQAGNGPSLIVPVREIPNGSSYFSPITSRDASGCFLGTGGLPGSEALAVHIATTLFRSYPGRVLQTPSLAEMRTLRCRRVIFIDDILGSGSRILEFMAAFRVHPTVKSWLSYKLLELHLCVYAATDGGLEAARACGFSQIVHVRRCPTFADQPWTPSLLARVEEVCRRYVPRRARKQALGFRESRCTMVFEHSVPNNIPAILWKAGKVPQWSPLFPGRVVPTALRGVFGDGSLRIELVERLRRLGQRRLAEGAAAVYADPQMRRILLVLAALARLRSAWSEDAVADATGLNRLEVDSILDACRRWRLIDADSRLTVAGRMELEHARKVLLPEDEDLEPGTVMYYPRSLRRDRPASP